MKSTKTKQEQIEMIKELKKQLLALFEQDSDSQPLQIKKQPKQNDNK